jgi:Ricin-type beta-trefoil lectin domain-like
MERRRFPRLLRAALLPLMLVPAAARGQIAVDGLDGPVTANEIATFKAFLQTRTPSGDNVGNDWVYGGSGTDLEALAMVYETTRDQGLLDRAIQFADKALSVRNDAATGRVIWTGRRELCWPNKDTAAEDARYCGSENGDVIGHVAYVARLILQTPALANAPVRGGDPFGFGATYRARALRYVREMDRSIDTFMLPSFVSAADGQHYRWPTAAAYGTLGPRYESARGKPIPWNQQTMISNGFLRLAECHEILGDDPERVRRYDAIVRSNMAWFLGDLHPLTHEGRPVYDWGYSLGRRSEDVGHGGYDIWGLYRAYLRGGYGVGRAQVVAFANTLAFVIHDEATGAYSTRVDGTNGDDSPRSFIHATFALVAEYLRQPDLYRITAQSNLTRARARPLDAAVIFWMKHRRQVGPLAGHYRILARHSGKAVVVRSGSTAEGANVVQGTPGGAAPNDEWTFETLGDGHYRILNRHSGQALNVSGGSIANAGDVVQSAYHGDPMASDEWRVENVGGGFHRIANRRSGKVLNVAGASTAEGANVDQWTWRSVNQQMFQIVSVP